ncbi:MAG: hypothetical protein HQ525_03635 [Anaerolineae bacterium]|nr:hypothetical protein [Anaerolineae bacterium]
MSLSESPLFNYNAPRSDADLRGKIVIGLAIDIFILTASPKETNLPNLISFPLTS